MGPCIGRGAKGVLRGVLGSRRSRAAAAALAGCCLCASAGGAPPTELDTRALGRRRVAPLTPAQHTPQRLAVTRERLGALLGDRWLVLRLSDLKQVARMPRRGAQALVGLTGGSLLAAGARGVWRLSRAHTAARAFPPAPLLGGSTWLRDPHQSQRLWIHYFGLPRVAKVDLGAPRPLAALTGFLPVQQLLKLPGFDTRAIVAPADGSLVYSTPAGLARRDINGVVWPLSVTALSNGVWRLLPAARRDEVWAATGRRLIRIRVRPGGGAVEELALPRAVVAVAAQGLRVAALSLPMPPTHGAAPEFRLSVLSPAGEATTVPLAMPLGAEAFVELALTANPPWAFVLGSELWVVDLRTGAVALRVAPEARMGHP